MGCCAYGSCGTPTDHSAFKSTAVANLAHAPFLLAKYDMRACAFHCKSRHLICIEIKASNPLIGGCVASTMRARACLRNKEDLTPTCGQTNPPPGCVQVACQGNRMGQSCCHLLACRGCRIYPLSSDGMQTRVPAQAAQMWHFSPAVIMNVNKLFTAKKISTSHQASRS